MQADSNLIAVVLAAAAVGLSGVFAYLRRLKRERYLHFWATGWLFIALQQAVFAMQPAGTPGVSFWFAEKLLLGGAALLFVWAAFEYVQKPPQRNLLIGTAGAVLLWAGAFRFGVFPLSPDWAFLTLFLGAAWIHWDHARSQQNRFDRFPAAAFVLLGLVAAIVSADAAPLANLMRALGAFLSVPMFLAAALMVLAAFERQGAEIERNVIALSSLNLAASGAQSGEADKVVPRALDCVLAVVGFPAGAILLRQGGSVDQPVLFTTGLTDSFRDALAQSDLRDYLVQLTSRLGGLAVFHDLGRDATWSALEHEEMFARFRRLAIEQGWQTVVGIGLQAGQEANGVLLLVAPDRRDLNASEFRLLSALGQQIGVAVGNSGLMQSARRLSEELHVLNAIGQALSSTLDREALLDKICVGMQRLFGMSDFYIALADDSRAGLSFELEVAGGERKNRRFRPAGNHLSEYILRTREPVLIQENFDAETAKLGVIPVQRWASYCGVPLVVHDRVIGVMAVLGHNERMFDEGHLKLLLVLANQAAIALENARLLREEQTRARHLTLLNNISRFAIAMLHPDELLARIAEQLERGLTFDHVGIGLLDQATKEVAIVAEAGRRHGAVGRVVKPGISLVGHVAGSGQVGAVRDVAAGTEAQLMLDDSVSSVALPLLFAEQIIGVLYVETDTAHDFSEEEIQILTTLTDVVSSALHHAQTLQQAREQAVTDGLTGVKTHRYLLEALSAEWKRSTRAGRPFCVVLADLDRFKFVNDFFGHLEGDLVLKRVGRILEQNCRASDVVARYGGDEFVILLPESDIEQSRQLAEKLRACIHSDSFLRSKNVTSSIGIAAFPADGATPQELIQIADASMYLSKHQGGNAVSTAGHLDADEARQWRRDVLEAYLGVTLKRLFSTGPEAFAEIRRRLEQFSQSLPIVETSQSGDGASSSRNVLPPAVMETVTSLALAIDAKDPYTQGHSPKVANYAALIAERLGLSEAEVEQVRLGGMLHDLGKVGIPESILNKSGPLNPEEWELMKEHVRFGYRLLEPLRTLADVRTMVLHHHEMYDGSGYPDGRVGDDIPLGARIIAIADAYDTITSDRTYKKARPAQAALDEIERCSGAQFDPELVHIFVEAMRDFARAPLAAAAGRSQESGS